MRRTAALLLLAAPAAVVALRPPVAARQREAVAAHDLPGPGATEVGAAACATCHQAMHRKWSGGRHSRMLQPATPESVRGDFSAGAVDLRGQRYGLRSEAGAYFITERYLTGRPRERRVEYTLGSRRIQHYLTTLEDGRVVVLPPSWDVGRRQWFHNLEIVDLEESGGTKVQVWNTNCFGCHVSGQEKRFLPATLTYATRWQDFGTSCERCHGPGSRHVEPAAGARFIVRPTRLGPERETAVCAQCHSLRDVTAAGFAAGADYHDHFMPILEYAQKPGTDPAYWPDGRPRRFSNDAMGLWQSACFLKGGATCVSCHVDPHEPDVERNPQLAPRENGICLRCHEEKGRDLAAHTRHAPQGSGSSCVECHMPKTVVSIKATMRDHAIGPPAPENTVRFGVPNACNACHADRSAAWARDALRRWGAEGSSARLVRRAEAFTGGRKGEKAALPPLLALAADSEEPPLVRANAVGHLRRYPEPRTVTAVAGALRDPSPVVRAVAALTVSELPSAALSARPALVAALADERRIVRVAAAFTLMNSGVRRLEGEEGRRFETAKREYVARAALLDDDPVTQLNVGKFLFLDGAFERAASAFEVALRLRPQQPGGHYFLALARLGEGRPEEARRLLSEVPGGDPYAETARGLLKKLPAR